MKRKASAAGLLAVVGSLLCNLTACGRIQTGAPAALTANATNLSADIQPQNVNGKKADSDFIISQTAFALQLMQHAAAADSQENVLISPFSVMQALAMTANGADGETLAEMAKVLGTDIDTLNEYLYTLRTSQQNTADARLVSANSIWFRDDKERISVLPEFLQKNADYYGAASYASAFDQGTADAINAWVSVNTDQMIPKLIDSIKKDDVMYLINAVAFDAKWEKQYQPEDIEQRDFTCFDGTKKPVQMMLSEESKYYGTDHAVGFAKYYRGGKYAFAALLPEEGLSPADFLASMTAEDLASLLASPQSCKVSAGLPQFTFDYDTELSGALADMGMASAFENADFSRIAKNNALQISAVLHKTHIEVDADGTKAAAATAIVATDGALMEPEDIKYVILDRPFVCMILDTETNLPVFIGTVGDF